MRRIADHRSRTADEFRGRLRSLMYMATSREQTMKNLIARGALPGSETADVFNGNEHGNVPVSMFLVHNRPGDGPELHRHPYAEVFVVQAGDVSFELDGSSVAARAGDVVIAPAGVAHRFTNVGSGELSMTCIHPVAGMETEWL